MKKNVRICTGAAVWGLFLSRVLCETCYVDYEGGNDAQTGKSMAAPLKHCPGDPASAGNARQIQLKAGDTVVFKGGVAYRGVITLKTSGTPEQPVILDGNTAGTFGTGRAIIEGGDRLDGWKKCESPEEAKGNPYWEKIRYTDSVPDNADPYTVNLCQGDLMFHPAVYPCSGNPAVWSDAETALTPAAAPDTTNPEEHFFADPYFKQTSAGAWDGAYIGIRAGANHFYMTPVTRFVPEANQIYFKAVKAPYYSDLSKHRFVMLNALEVLTRPGQYVLAPKPQGKGLRLYCLPVEGRNFPEDATVSVRPAGIVISAARHLIIRGFLIQNQVDGRATGIRCIEAGAEYITIENNHLRHQKGLMTQRSPAIGVTGCRNLTVRKNQLNDISGMAALVTGSQNIVFEENVFDSVLSTTVDFYGCENIRFLRNRISGLAGLHANGLTFYLGNENILIEGNVIAHENALTFKELDNIRIVNNVFDGIGRANAIAVWAGKPANNVVIEHNTIVNATRDPALDYCSGLYTANRDGTNWVIRNNIIDGAGGNITEKNGQMSHNLFLRVNPKFDRKELGANAAVELDAGKVFADPSKGDYRLRPGSPAVGAGIAGEVKTDINGKPVNAAKPDLGAYSF